ncbi:MAG: aldo/keto reductase [Alphaproteobacteria bacterium]
MPRWPLAPRLTRGQFLRGIAGVAAALVLPAADGRTSPAPMTTRPIPKSGEHLPVVGLGTWQTFDVGGGAGAREPLAEVLRLLFANGGSVVDSSPMYGRAEGVVGDLLATLGTRDKAFIATKVWTQGRRSGIRQMERSMELFKATTIDLMQIHNLVDWRTHLKTLRAWKEAGRIRYLGVTHYTPSAFDELMAVIEAEPVDFVQLPYSIAVRDAENRLLGLAADKGVAVLVNRPYEGGDLFGAVRGKPLPPWAADFDCASWGQFFLKFILGHPAVSCVIPGTSKPRHIADNAAAGKGRAPDENERRKMAALWQSL